MCTKKKTLSGEWGRELKLEKQENVSKAEASGRPTFAKVVFHPARVASDYWRVSDCNLVHGVCTVCMCDRTH